MQSCDICYTDQNQFKKCSKCSHEICLDCFKRVEKCPYCRSYLKYILLEQLVNDILGNIEHIASIYINKITPSPDMEDYDYSPKYELPIDIDHIISNRYTETDIYSAVYIIQIYLKYKNEYYGIFVLLDRPISNIDLRFSRLKELIISKTQLLSMSLMCNTLNRVGTWKDSVFFYNKRQLYHDIKYIFLTRLFHDHFVYYPDRIVN